MRYINVVIKCIILAVFVFVCGCGDKEYHEARKIVLVSSGTTEETKVVSHTSAVTPKKDSEPDNNSIIDDSTTVYYTKTGKRYHLLESCTGKEMLSCTLSEARENGLTPCQKCAVD